MKGQVIADFIAELLQKQAYPTNRLGEQWWALHVDRTSRVFRSGIRLILQLPTRELIEQAIHLNFSVSNNKAKYEACPSRIRSWPNVGYNQVGNQERFSANYWIDSMRV